MTSPYTAKLELDPSGIWLAELVEIPQVHTFGRTLGKAKEYLFDALALWLNVGVDEVDDSIAFLTPGLPREVTHKLVTANKARAAAESATQKSARATEEAVRALVDVAHLSTRDAAELLGISHQRVHQIHTGEASVMATAGTVTSGEVAAGSARVVPAATQARRPSRTGRHGVGRS